MIAPPSKQSQAPNPLRQIRAVLTSVIESVVGDIDKILSLDKDQKGNIVGKFHIADQVYDFTVTPDGKFTYDEAEKGGMRSDALLEGFYQGEWRSDAPRRSGGRRGKKCGDGYISADYECSVGLSPLMKERARSVFSVLGRTEARQQAERQQQQQAAPKKSGGLAKAAGTALAGAAIAAGVAASRRPGAATPALTGQPSPTAQKASSVPVRPIIGISTAIGLAAASQHPEAQRRLRVEATKLQEKIGKADKELEAALDAGKIPSGIVPPIKRAQGFARLMVTQETLRRAGYKKAKYNQENNVSTLIHEDGSVASIGSIDNNVVALFIDRGGPRHPGIPEKVSGEPLYRVSFTVNQDFNEKEGRSRRERLAIARMTNAAWTDAIAEIPDGAYLETQPNYGDGQEKGDKRLRRFEEIGFREVDPEESGSMVAQIKGGRPKSPSKTKLKKIARQFREADIKAPRYISTETIDSARRALEAMMSLPDRRQARGDSEEYLDRLDAVLEMIISDASINTIEGFLEARTDERSRPGYTWVDDRRVEGGGYWRKLPKRSTQIAKGVAGTAIVAAVVAGGAMALRSRQGTTPASAIAPKKPQDWHVPALGGAVAGAASAGFAVKWGTEAATKKQIERAKSEAQRLAEAQIEEIRNEEGNRLSSEVARLQKEADSRLSSELEKAKAESRAEYEPRLAATEQKRVALEQEIARRERDLEAERKQSGDRHATELEKAKAELRTEYESQLSIIREEKSALERAIAQRDASLENLGRQAKSTMEEQARQSNARLEIEIARVKAEYEQSLGEKESELQKVKTSSSKEIAKLSEGLKQQQATERDRISEGIKAGVEPAVKELEQARTQLQSDYENRIAKIQLDFESKAKEIEAGIAKEVLKRSQEAEERINADAQRQIEEGRQRSLKEAQAEIQAAEDKRLAGNTAKGSLITDDRDGIALSASIRRGMKLDEIPADSLQRRFSDAVDGLARRRLTREIASLGEDFAKRAKEIRSANRRPAEKWRMMEEALLRQTNRENGIGGAVDDVRREFRDRHLEALRSFLAKAEGRGKFDDDLIASFDKELTRLNKEMQERIDQAVKDTLDGQPLDLPPGTRKDSGLVEEKIWTENPSVEGGGYYPDSDPIQEARLLIRQAIAHTHQVQGLPIVHMDDDGMLRGTFLTPDRTRLEYAIALNGTLYVDGFRSDSDSKPCGKGWISEGEECHVGKSRLPSPLRRVTDKARQLIRQGNEREEKMRAKLQEKGIKLGTRTELLKEGVVAGMGYAGSVAAGPVGSVVASAGTRAVLVAGSKVRTAQEAEKRKEVIAEIAEETTKEMWGAIVGEVVSAGVTTAIGKSIPGVGMLPAMKTQGRLTEVTKAGVRAIARRTIKVGKGSSTTEKAAPDDAAQ